MSKADTCTKPSMPGQGHVALLSTESPRVKNILKGFHAAATLKLHSSEFNFMDNYK